MIRLNFFPTCISTATTFSTTRLFVQLGPLCDGTNTFDQVQDQGLDHNYIGTGTNDRYQKKGPGPGFLGPIPGKRNRNRSRGLTDVAKGFNPPQELKKVKLSSFLYMIQTQYSHILLRSLWNKNLYQSVQCKWKFLEKQFFVCLAPAKHWLSLSPPFGSFKSLTGPIWL